MIFYIMGKSASGKDSLYKKLIDANIGLKKVAIYTTRPKRDGEEEGEEYHFVDEKYLIDNNAKIIERRVYNTVYGKWYYATLNDGNIKDDENYIMIGTLESYNNLNKYYGKDKIYPIYLEVDDDIRRKRAIDRENSQVVPHFEEMERRFKADEFDFSEKMLKVVGITKRYNNNDFDKCFDEIVRDIKEVIS